MLSLDSGYSAYQYRFSNTNFKTTPPTSSKKMTVDNSFETLFAVPLSCDGCIKAVSDSLYKLGGINNVEGNLKDQLVTVKGTAAPSAIVEAIQATGRDAILRGSGASDSAAVSILETFEDPVDGIYEEPSRDVRGLARMVQVSSGRTLVDLTIHGVSPGTYRASIRAYGDLKNGATSTGPVWSGDDKKPRGDLGLIEVGEDGRGASFVDHGFQIWEVIGHAMVLTRQEEKSEPLKNDKDTVVGIIARSAGMWDNDKTVCSCTGKTLWEERKDEVKKGML
ncbi:copper chaperone [Fusarium chlamydosporum]